VTTYELDPESKTLTIRSEKVEHLHTIVLALVELNRVAGEVNR
jgi:hypothetical protein